MLVLIAIVAIASGIDRHGAARIEAEPTEPQDQAADRGSRHVVPRDGLTLAVGAVLADARAEDDDADQRRPAADRVHHRGTGEIEEAHLSPTSRRPRSSDRDRIDATPTIDA